MRRLLTSLLSLFVVLAASAVCQVTSLRVGVPVSGALVTGDTNSFEIELGADYFVYAEADQVTVDVVVTVFGPDGEKLGEWDGPGRGPEPVQFETETSGVYRITIAPFEDEAGEYVLTVSVAEPIAETPERRVEQLLARYDRDDIPVALRKTAPQAPYGNLIPGPGRGLVAVSASTIAFWAK